MLDARFERKDSSVDKVGTILHSIWWVGHCIASWYSGGLAANTGDPMFWSDGRLDMKDVLYLSDEELIEKLAR